MSSEIQGKGAAKAKKRAADAGGTPLTSAKSQLAGHKDRATEGLGQVSDALRLTRDHLRQSQSPLVEYVDRAAGQVDRLGGYLKQRELDDIIADVDRLARRQPGVVVGGALMLGLIASRFLKGSVQPPVPGPRTVVRGKTRGYAGTAHGKTRRRTHAGASPPISPPGAGDGGEAGQPPSATRR